MASSVGPLDILVVCLSFKGLPHHPVEGPCTLFIDTSYSTPIYGYLINGFFLKKLGNVPVHSIFDFYFDFLAFFVLLLEPLFTPQYV